MFVTTLLVQALLATAALTVPSSKERYEARVARRSGGLRSSRPMLANVTDAEYSTNWAGAVLNSGRVQSHHRSHIQPDD